MKNGEFKNLVVTNSEDLRNIALHLTRDPNDASDLIQETLFKALSNQSKFRDGTNIKAWLYTIMKNIFINDYRRKNRRQTVLDSTDNDYLLNSGDTVLENDGISNLHLNDLNRAFTQVDSSLKVPFLMHYKGYKYEEIAEQLNLPLGTVKSRIHMARKALKKLLKSYRA